MLLVQDETKTTISWWMDDELKKIAREIIAKRKKITHKKKNGNSHSVGELKASDQKGKSLKII